MQAAWGGGFIISGATHFLGSGGPTIKRCGLTARYSTSGGLTAWRRGLTVGIWLGRQTLRCFLLPPFLLQQGHGLDLVEKLIPPLLLILFSHLRKPVIEASAFGCKTGGVPSWLPILGIHNFVGLLFSAVHRDILHGCINLINSDDRSINLACTNSDDIVGSSPFNLPLKNRLLLIDSLHALLTRG
jgi:hypothetical protein